LTSAVAVSPLIVTRSTSRSKSSASLIALSSSCSQLAPAARMSSASDCATISAQIAWASPVSPADCSSSTTSATFFCSPSNSLDDDVPPGAAGGEQGEDERDGEERSAHAAPRG